MSSDAIFPTTENYSSYFPIGDRGYMTFNENGEVVQGKLFIAQPMWPEQEVKFELTKTEFNRILEHLLKVHDYLTVELILRIFIKYELIDKMFEKEDEIKFLQGIITVVTDEFGVKLALLTGSPTKIHKFALMKLEQYFFIFRPWLNSLRTLGEVLFKLEKISVLLETNGALLDEH